MRSRSADGEPARTAASTTEHPPSEPPRRLRGEQRDAQVRAGLTELGPDERPAPLIVAVVVSVVLGLANIVLWLSGWSPADDNDSPIGALLFATIMGVMAFGLWHKRYWALLGMQVLLALVIVYAFLSLLVASNLAAVALCLGAALPSGWLFWKLVRVMARVQMPRARRD